MSVTAACGTAEVWVAPGVPAEVYRRLWVALAALLVVVSAPGVVRVFETAAGVDVPGAVTTLAAPDAAAAVESLGGLPLSWVANTGQTDPQVRFLANGLGYAAFLTDTEAVIDVGGAVVRLGFEGASPAPVSDAQEPLAGTVASFVGADASKWQSAAATSAVVRYDELWPGIDATFRVRAGNSNGICMWRRGPIR